MLAGLLGRARSRVPRERLARRQERQGLVRCIRAVTGRFAEKQAGVAQVGVDPCLPQRCTATLPLPSTPTSSCSGEKIARDVIVVIDRREGAGPRAHASEYRPADERRLQVELEIWQVTVELRAEIHGVRVCSDLWSTSAFVIAVAVSVTGTPGTTSTRQGAELATSERMSHGDPTVRRSARQRCFPARRARD